MADDKILVDTCGWIEWVTDGVLSDKYEHYLKTIERVIVPTSVQFELYKWVSKQRSTQAAIEVVALTEQAQVIALSTPIALLAADLANEHKLSFADSIIYASSQFHQAELITSDSHFKNLQDVIYFEKN